VLIGLAAPTSASARPIRPTEPTGLRVVRVSSSSFTVATQRTQHARTYRVFAARTIRALAVATIGHTAMKSKLSTSPTVTIGHLPYTSAPYFYRVEALNGSRNHFSSTIGSVGLLPQAPTDLRASTSDTGTYLTWNAGASTGFEISQATDPGMTQNVTTYLTTGADHTFSPTGLVPGTRYYFQVRAMNGSTAGAYSAPVEQGTTTIEQPVSVMTYNILESTDDGRVEGGQRVAPWSQRLPGAVSLIRQANPDVIAIQEGAAFVGSSTTERQVDSLVSALDGTYSLADTEIAPPQRHYFRTGVYILYKTADYAPVGTGDHWSLGDNRYAAYQVLKNLKTDARFLMVASHLEVGTGTSFDAGREAETKQMLLDAGAYAGSSDLPIVYAGDFNSDGGAIHDFDGPGIEMRAEGVADSYDSAQTVTNAQYDSSNDYMQTAPAHNEAIDHVYVSPGIGVTSWNLILDLTDGQFVGVIPSDHNPLVADLLIPYTPPPPAPPVS
jgi:endonuclease/exonuclease/phosphatase family metal-dependent hydrolase